MHKHSSTSDVELFVGKVKFYEINCLGLLWPETNKLLTAFGDYVHNVVPIC